MAGPLRRRDRSSHRQWFVLHFPLCRRWPHECDLDGFVSEISHSLCKLLVALGDHSAMYFAKNIASPSQVKQPPPCPFPLPSPFPPVSHLVQNFLRLLLAYTALPGYYGVDEEESEMTLSYWYLFQEALWNSDYGFDVAEDGDSGDQEDERERSMMPVAKAVYTELVAVLRRKVVWPPRTVLNGWARGESRTITTMHHSADAALQISAISSWRKCPHLHTDELRY